MWSNTLQGGEISVPKNQYYHDIQVFAEMKCASLGEYHDVYLATDVLLLASVFEAFREVWYETYGLDCACYSTASNLSGDFSKVCNADLKLITEREHFNMVQKMIRRGMSSIYARRFLKANNKYLEDYNPEEPSSYLLKTDANNLYGGIKKHCPLPIKDFSKVEESSNIFCKPTITLSGDTFWKWISVYLKNSRLIMSARNKFEENIYKLIVKSAFGKTMETKLGCKKLEIIRNERELLQKTALSTMKSFQIIDEEVATVGFAVTSILRDKPMIIGASILDLSKRFMFYFHYRQMKANMNLELIRLFMR